MTFAAAAIRGLTGFGMAIILVPLLGLIIRPDEAVVVGIFLQLLIGPAGMRNILREADRASALTIGLIAMMTTPFGVMLLARTTPDVARLAIALIAIGAFALVLLPKHGERRPRLPVTLATGAAAGVLTGFAAMPGPPVVPYYLRQPIAPATARASMMLVFFATAFAGTLSTVLLGLGTMRLALLSLLLFPAVLFGNWAGGLAFGRMPDKVWRTIVAVILGVAGLSAVLRLLN